MKKVYVIFISFIIALLACPNVILAVTGGGTGSSGEGSGTGGSGTATSNFYYQFGNSSNLGKVAAYKMELAYFDKDGNRDIIATAIVQGTYVPGSYGVSATGIDKMIKNYYEYLKNSNVENLKHIKTGPLVDLANNIENGNDVSDLFPGRKIENYETIKDYITSSQGFGISMDDAAMQREQDANPGKYESYGYRILIQKITFYGINGRYAFAAPRKEVAYEIVNNNGIYGKQGVNKCVQLFGGDSGFTRELYTEQDDVHIKTGTGYAGRIASGYSGNGLILNWSCQTHSSYEDDKTEYLADYQNGLGYNILWFDVDQFRYDYSIDAACVNCNSNKADNTAYVIQDTTDWDAILASPNSTNANVTKYYVKTKGVYCREEYYVYFPNADDTVYVEPGRYFTVNASAADLNNISISTIPNMKPVKVVKKRECKVKTDEAGTDANTALDAFRMSAEYDFKNRTGTVKFKYNETYFDSKYNMSSAEEMDPYDEADNYTYYINGGTLTMEITKYYKLPNNYYQYIRKRDGLSMKTMPSESDLGSYINVGIANLPVSFNNKGTDSGKAADIQFTYELPGENNDTDRYSLLNEAYKADNSYLKTETQKGNIYKQYKEDNLNDASLIDNSACAKMFGKGTSEFDNCVNQRTSNAIGSGSNNCYTKNQIASSVMSGYSCVVLTHGDDDDDNSCSTEEDANRLGQDWNPISQSCCPAGTVYNEDLGKCAKSNVCRIENGKYYDFNGNEITKSEYDEICPNKCRIENGKYYDFDGNEITKEEYDVICPGVCRIENGKYYDFSGNEITKDEYDIICPSDVPSNCDSGCEYGCCPSGECAWMPRDANGEPYCPGTGGIDVIYRTIDLENPFPGQNAEQRNTGANWCSYNIKTQKIDCKYNNSTVKDYITRERSGIVHGGEIYRESHILYEVTLDTKTINSIRKYNDQNQYDDWDLNCLDNGRACISEFLRDEVTVTGECSNATKNTFYTCDEDV